MTPEGMTLVPTRTVFVARSRPERFLHHLARVANAVSNLKTFVPGRKEERFQIELPIRFEGREGIARDVSASGIYFVTDAALEVGQAVKFMLEFANFPGGPIAVDCVARVVRLEEKGTGRGVGASISSFAFHRIPAPGKSDSEHD
jgi:hypothetical protein